MPLPDVYREMPNCKICSGRGHIAITLFKSEKCVCIIRDEFKSKLFDAAIDVGDFNLKEEDLPNGSAAFQFCKKVVVGTREKFKEGKHPEQTFCILARENYDFALKFASFVLIEAAASGMRIKMSGLEPLHDIYVLRNYSNKESDEEAWERVKEYFQQFDVYVLTLGLDVLSGKKAEIVDRFLGHRRQIGKFTVIVSRFVDEQSIIGHYGESFLSFLKNNSKSCVINLDSREIAE